MRKKTEIIDRNKLVDIRDVVINTELPKEERIKDYVRQIKNPYCFKCGKYVVISKFSDSNNHIKNIKK